MLVGEDGHPPAEDAERVDGKSVLSITSLGVQPGSSSSWTKSSSNRPARRSNPLRKTSTGMYESPRTTKLYDRTGDEITLDEVERIAI